MIEVNICVKRRAVSDNPRIDVGASSVGSNDAALAMRISSQVNDLISNLLEDDRRERSLEADQEGGEDA